MELKYKIQKGVISVGAVGLLMVCTSTLMFVHNPLQSIVRMILSFSESSIFYKLWADPPYQIYLKIHLFNITNPKQFLDGSEKMNVSEIGPYVYREIFTNANATFNDTEGTVTYSPHRTYIFEAEKSVGDSKVDSLLTTNLPLVGLQAYLSDSSFFTNLGFATFARSVGAEPIVNLTIDEYLWGYKDKLITYANTFLPSWIDFDSFGIFERLLKRDNSNSVTMVTNPAKYHSSTDHLLTEEQRGSEFHLAKWNDKPGLKEWGYGKVPTEQLKKCHLLEGAFDGTIFPKNLRANRSITLFRNSFCRPVALDFVRDGKSKEGFYQYEYKFADNMFDTDPECFCLKDKCYKGIQNIGQCYYGIPITLSQPHFLNADEKVREKVHGLSPDLEKHHSTAAIQPNVGAPLSGSIKIQINLEVGSTKANSKTARFNNMQIPLFWIEITTEELPPMVVFLMYLVCNVVPAVLEIAKYLLGLGGVALISGSALYILLKASVQMPGRISLANTEYVSFPIITVQADFLDKCEKRLSLK